MVNFVKEINYNNRSSSKVCQAWHHLTGLSKDQYYNSWKYVPTIISDRDSDLVGVKIPQTQDVREEKVQLKSTRWPGKILGKWTMEAGSRNNSSSLNQGEDEEVADGLSVNSSRIPNRWISTIMRQGNNICQIKWYNVVCPRKNIHH
jgi:hypothetical protein